MKARGQHLIVLAVLLLFVLHPLAATLTTSKTEHSIGFGEQQQLTQAVNAASLSTAIRPSLNSFKSSSKDAAAVSGARPHVAAADTPLHSKATSSLTQTSSSTDSNAKITTAIAESSASSDVLSRSRRPKSSTRTSRAAVQSASMQQAVARLQQQLQQQAAAERVAAVTAKASSTSGKADATDSTLANTSSAAGTTPSSTPPVPRGASGDAPAAPAEEEEVEVIEVVEEVEEDDDGETATASSRAEHHDSSTEASLSTSADAGSSASAVSADVKPTKDPKVAEKQIASKKTEAGEDEEEFVYEEVEEGEEGEVEKEADTTDAATTTATDTADDAAAAESEALEAAEDAAAALSAAEGEVDAELAGAEGTEEYVQLLPEATTALYTWEEDTAAAQLAAAGVSVAAKASQVPSTSAATAASIGAAAELQEEAPPVVKKPAHLAKVYIADLLHPKTLMSKATKTHDSPRHHIKSSPARLQKQLAAKDLQLLKQAGLVDKPSRHQSTGTVSDFPTVGVRGVIETPDDLAKLNGVLQKHRIQAKLAETERQIAAALRKQKHHGHSPQVELEQEQQQQQVLAGAGISAKGKHHTQGKESDGRHSLTKKVQLQLLEQQEEDALQEMQQHLQADPNLYGDSPQLANSFDNNDCFKPLLQAPFFNREDPSSLNNAYIAMLLSRYTYPTAFGININTNASRATYQELFRRKWIAMGAKPSTISFQDVGGVGNRLHRMINHQQPEAHSVVFATSNDVWIGFRGLTSVDSALTSDMRHAPTEATFSSQNVAVHSGFFNGFRAIWPQVMMAVKQAIMQTDDPAEAKIYITGHSLGGAHAVFTALKLVDIKLPNIGALYLFGAPRMGQQSFANLFSDNDLERVTFHWWNELDMVPNLGTTGPWKRARYTQLPETTLYRIWDGQCQKAEGATAEPCPLGTRRCRKSVTDHRAFSYVAKLQACVLQQDSIADSSCLTSKVMSSM